MSLRIVFMGTPDFSVPTLRALHAAGHEIVACYSQPPRPAGRRGLELVASPVHNAADDLGIPVYTPKSLKGAEEQAEFAAHSADVAVVIAYGLLLPKAILDAPRFGCFNGHASLLPRWRGAAPIQRAIMAGDDETGMMVMQMEEGLDTGPVAATARQKIAPDMTAGKLHDALSAIGAGLMVGALASLEAGTLALEPQPEDGVVYAAKIAKGEARLDWDQPAQTVQRLVMGLSPFPGAWCEMDLGGKVHRVKILEATVAGTTNATPGTVIDEHLTIACQKGALRLTRLQRAGAKAMSAEEFLRGNDLTVGAVLT